MVRRASFWDRKHLQDLCGELPWRGSSGTHRGGGAGDGRRCSWNEAQKGNGVIRGDDRVEYLKNYCRTAKRGITMTKPADSMSCCRRTRVASVTIEFTSELETR